MPHPHRILGILVLALIATPLSAQEPPAVDASGEDADSVAHIDARGDQRVRAMSDFLAGQKKMRFSVEITYDAVEPDGQKIQLGRRSVVEVMKPNGLRAESQGDRGWNQVSVFNGQQFLLHDRTHNVYAQIKTPATLEAFFSDLFERFGTTPPLVDFLLDNVHGALTKNAESVALLGDAFVAQRDCDHVVFSSDLLDWQLWVEKGDQPWPRKFVITYKDVDVRPQFMAVFREWRADESLTAARFATSPPAGATEVALERFAREESTDDDAPDADADAPDADSQDGDD